MSRDAGKVEAVPGSSLKLDLNAEELDVLLKLLEFSEMEIHRVFKKLTTEDIDLKEIYYYYRIHSRRLRKRMKNLRGY